MSETNGKRDMVPAATISSRHPNLPDSTLRGWARKGLVYTEPDPARRRYVLYDDVEVSRRWTAGSRRAGEAVDRFTDENGRELVWIRNAVKDPTAKANGLAADAAKSRWVPETLYRLQDECPALPDGRGLQIVPVFFPDHRQRDYVIQAELDKLREFLKVDTLDPADNGDWATLKQSLDMGFDHEFLIRFSRSEDPRRTKTAGQHHPKLKDFIKTKRVQIVRKGEFVWVVLYWRKHLTTLAEEVKRPLWATWAEATGDPYWLPGPLVNSYRDPANIRRRNPEKPLPKVTKGYPLLGGHPLREEMLPVVTKRGRRAEVLHFWREHLDTLAKSSMRPNDPGRVHVEKVSGKDERFLPMLEIAQRIGVTPLTLWYWREDQRGCEFLPDGRGIAVRHVAMRIYKGKGPKVWVYSESDADVIKAETLRRRGEATATTAGLVLRGEDERPLVNGRPAKRKLTLAEYDAVATVLDLQAKGVDRPGSAELKDENNTGRRRALNRLAKDPEFGAFISTPAGVKGGGYAVSNAKKC